MKALFYTTETIDCINHVRAWESVFGSVPHVTYNHRGVCNSWQLTEAIERHRPAVIFYIGAHEAPGNPKPNVFIEARKSAKVVNLCSDAGDKPWHPVLTTYRALGCFDLQVGIDGALNAPVDLVTLTPVDPRPFAGPEMERTIRFGFSGSVGHWNARSEVIRSLEWFGGLTVRPRAISVGYIDHVRFLRRCRVLLNVSRTGTGARTHIKGRVLEAGWARTCLLEDESSPIAQWFPDDCYLMYRNPKDAAALVKSLDDETVERTARRLSEEVRARFTPALIYNAILEKLGLVAAAEPIQAA